jgi:hypothetical protein
MQDPTVLEGEIEQFFDGVRDLHDAMKVQLIEGALVAVEVAFASGR